MKTIFITGGSTGIGAACVRKFIREGWNVCFMDVNAGEASALCDELGNPSSLLFAEGNTRSREDIHSAVEACACRFGKIDAVFANAGIHSSDTLLSITDEDMDLMVRTNIYGTVNTLRECVPHLIDAGGGSIVINVSDQWFVGKAHNFLYGMTKGALGQITRSLSIDLGPHNIRVNAVCPGTIRTPLVDRIFDEYSAKNSCSVEDCWKEENALFARGSAGTPEEVASMVFFLSGDEALFCTGGHYLVDGGLVAR